jgi:hypothetical protein
MIRFEFEFGLKFDSNLEDWMSSLDSYKAKNRWEFCNSVFRWK